MGEALEPDRQGSRVCGLGFSSRGRLGCSGALRWGGGLLILVMSQVRLWSRGLRHYPGASPLLTPLYLMLYPFCSAVRPTNVESRGLSSLPSTWGLKILRLGSVFSRFLLCCFSIDFHVLLLPCLQSFAVFAEVWS